MIELQDEYKRYAIYFAPRTDSALAELGRSWLGVDAETKWIGEAPTPFVESPRKYGFHATLKAPMRLEKSCGFEDLRSAVEQMSGSLAVVNLGVLKMKQIGSFIALVPDRDKRDAVSKLAWRCVQELDFLRAPVTDAERNKRPNISEEEKLNLERWGYPFVGGSFRFHMTLTSSLSREDQARAEELLTDKIPEQETILDSICIFGDPVTKPFELVERFELKV